MSEFRDQMAEDIENVFLNAAEFAEEIEYHRIVDGEDVDGFPVDLLVVCEDVQVDRELYPDQVLSDTRSMVANIPTALVSPVISTDYIERDGEDWTVVEILGESEGMARIRTEALGLVRRGGREIER